MSVAVSNTTRLVLAIDRLCEASHLTYESFVNGLTVRCDHPVARDAQARCWSLLAAEAGVLEPDSRVRRRVLNYLQARSTAA